VLVKKKKKISELYAQQTYLYFHVHDIKKYIGLIFKHKHMSKVITSDLYKFHSKIFFYHFPFKFKLVELGEKKNNM